MTDLTDQEAAALDAARESVTRLTDVGRSIYRLETITKMLDDAVGEFGSRLERSREDMNEFTDRMLVLIEAAGTNVAMIGTALGLGPQTKG